MGVPKSRQHILKQRNLFSDDIDILGNYNRVINDDPDTRVTVWYRWNEKKKRWEHNHYENGWSEENTPNPSSDEQQVWLKCKWRSELRWLINHQIVEL